MATRVPRKAILAMLEEGIAQPLPNDCTKAENVSDYRALMYSRSSGSLNHKNGVVLQHRETGAIFAAVGHGSLGAATIWC